jgi:hypothetical protein
MFAEGSGAFTWRHATPDFKVSSCLTEMPGRQGAEPGILSSTFKQQRTRRTSADVLKPVLAHNLLHLIFQLELELFQTMFLDFFIGSQRRFAFQPLYEHVVFVMLVHEIAKSFVRLHQMRFEFFLNSLVHPGISP